VSQSKVAAASIVALLVSGCYTTAAVPPAQLASIEHPLDAPRSVGDGVRLGPRTEIRARLADGSVTTWLPAGRVAVAKEGLVTGRSYPLGAATGAVLSDAGDGARAMLEAAAPPGADVTLVDGELCLRVPDARLLLPWLAGYATGAATLHQPSGVLSFHGAGGSWRSGPISAADLGAMKPADLARLEIAEGIPWRLVSALDLHNLDTLRTTGAIIGAPFAGALMVLSALGTVAAVADGDDPSPSIDLGVGVASVVSDAAANADARASAGGAPLRATGARPAVLLAPDEPSATVRVTPLFSARARRRDAFKLVLEGEAGVTTEGAFTGAAGIGARLGDFLELTARARSLSLAAPALYGGPAPSPAQHLLFGGRMGLHIDTDGNPLTAFVFGGEVLAGQVDGQTVTELGLVLGPRFGIGDKMFASLLVTPSVLLTSGQPGRSDTATMQMLFTGEIGFDL